MDSPDKLSPAQQLVRQIVDPEVSVILQVIHPEALVIARLSLPLVKIVFQRALNTWADAPPELFDFSDQLEKL